MAATRIAFDVGPLAGARTGIGHAVAALHAALSARDDIELQDYITSFRADPQPGVRRLPLPAALAHRTWARLGLPKVDRWLGDAQLVHGTNYVVPPSRLPRLVSVYDCWFLRNRAESHPAVRRAGDVLRRAVATGAVVHTSSVATATAIAELLPGARVEVVPLGPLPLAAPTAPPVARLAERRFILAISTLERRKNLPRLVAAFASIASDLPDVDLVLAGADGDDRPAIDAALAQVGPHVAARVVLTGRVDEGERSWLLHHAAVLAYPSLDEGFGFPLLDAMQVGVPVVASNAGSIPEVAGGAALLSRPDDVAALAANMYTMLTVDEVRTRMVSAGTSQLQQFSWERCAAELAAIYGRLVREGR